MKIEEFNAAKSLAAVIASDSRWPALREAIRRLVKHTSDPSPDMACHRHGVSHGINTIIFFFEEAKSEEVQKGFVQTRSKSKQPPTEATQERDADLDED
jgi:hypothetical protein